MSKQPKVVQSTGKLRIVEIGRHVADAGHVREILTRVGKLESGGAPAAHGRTAWIALDEPLRIEGSGGGCKALKVKGVGKALRAVGSGALKTYVSRPGYPPHRHLAFDPDGSFRLVEGRSAPDGGLALGAARMEFRISKLLMRRGCRSIVPVALLEADDLAYRDEALGVVVTGLPDGYRYRADAIVGLDDIGEHSGRAAYARAVAASLGVSVGADTWRTDRLTLVGEIYRAFGKALRDFATAGFYRYSGASDNIFFSVALGEVLLIDLDTSCELESASEVTAPLEIVRDVMSGMFNLACELIHPAQIALSDRESMEAANPYRAFLEGYFPDVTLTEDVAGPFNRHAAEAWSRVSAHRAEILADPTTGYALYRSLRFDTLLVYSALFRLAYSIFLRSALAREHPPPFDEDTLDGRIAAFIGRGKAGVARCLAGVP